MSSLECSPRRHFPDFVSKWTMLVLNSSRIDPETIVKRTSNAIHCHNCAATESGNWFIFKQCHQQHLLVPRASPDKTKRKRKLELGNLVKENQIAIWNWVQLIGGIGQTAFGFGQFLIQTSFSFGFAAFPFKELQKIGQNDQKGGGDGGNVELLFNWGEQRQRGEGFSGWKWSIFRAIESISEMIGGKCLKRKWRFSAEEETDGATHNNNNKKWKHK